MHNPTFRVCRTSGGANEYYDLAYPQLMPDIRTAVPDEWREYRDIRLRALKTAPEAYGSTWADEHDGRAVGTAVGIPDRHEIGSREIVAVWVEPDYRGQGLAQQLVMTLVEWATDAAADAIALWVSDGNDVARRAYERCGFSATGERETLPNGHTEARMRRALKSPTG
jgi:GNAT superfamily N-acetyltransferase